MPSCLSPHFPWPLALLTCSPQTLPTVAHGRILICARSPSSYSPVFWGHGVGDTPSCARAALPDPYRDWAALGGPGSRRGGPAGWAALRPCPPRPVSAQGFPLRRRGLAKGQRDISTHRCGDARRERDPPCVCVHSHCPSGFSPQDRFSDLALPVWELPLRSPLSLAEKPGGASPAHAQSKEPAWIGNIFFL